MGNNKEEMLTVKEWDQKAGLKFYNYDGYIEIYNQLSSKDTTDFTGFNEARFFDVGELLCTRTGFESGIFESSMRIPEISEYESISNVLPNYIEGEINTKISCILADLNRQQLEKSQQIKSITELLRLLKLKLTVRKKSISITGISRKNPLDKVKQERLSQTQRNWLRRFNILRLNKGTIEDLEEYLLDKIIKNKKKLNLCLTKISLSLNI